jgi:glycosyltransferase involved in cell wall biosynthesis
MRASDVLMVIDAPFAQSPFLPSKLVDYLGARKPILGVTPPGESRDLIQRCGYPTADPRDVAAVAEAIGDLADRVIAERSGSAEADAAPQAKVYRAYHIDMIQASYAALVAELNRGRAR